METVRPTLLSLIIGSDNVSVLLGNGDGTFQAQKTYAVGDGPHSVAVGDFNGDGKADLAVANRVERTMYRSFLAMETGPSRHR